MTKKQTAALSRMICREISRFDGDNTIQAGVHTAYDRYIVTDGTAAIILPEMPDTLRKGSQMDSIYDVIRRNMENADHILADTVTADHIRTWKQLAKPWKAGKDAKTGAVPVEITAQNNVTEALSKFQLKFKDIHINELCSVIRQGYETGNVVNAIANVTKHLNDIQKAVELRNNQKLDNNITKVQMVILLSIMVIVIYGIITSMSSFNIF